MSFFSQQIQPNILKLWNTFCGFISFQSDSETLKYTYLFISPKKQRNTTKTTSVFNVFRIRTRITKKYRFQIQIHMSQTKKTVIVDVIYVNNVMWTVGWERLLPEWGPGWMGIRHHKQEAGPPSK
jgi:hypothetical protein